MSLWSLREKPPSGTRKMLELGGFTVLVLTWMAVAAFIDNKALCPSPIDVWRAFPALLKGQNVPITEFQRPFSMEASILWHALYSFLLNVASYAVAIGIAVPVGFAIGLWGPIRAAVERELAGFRYLPITAFVGVFVAWFGISHSVKVAFLSSGLLVYLIPQVVQRIDEVEAVYHDTAKTCGATRWQRIRTVFWPLVAARLSDDCRNLVAITWTYLIVAEGFNLGQGGLGAHAIARGRAWQLDYVFAIVVIIAAIGWASDRVWLAADRRIFRWKYA